MILEKELDHLQRELQSRPTPLEIDVLCRDRDAVRSRCEELQRTAGEAQAALDECRREVLLLRVQVILIYPDYLNS